jgi:hypothetical protein
MHRVFKTARDQPQGRTLLDRVPRTANSET